MKSDGACARVAANARALRKRHGWTMQQVGEASGLGLRAVQHVESGTGNPTCKTLDRLAAGLGVDVAELLAPLA